MSTRKKFAGVVSLAATALLSVATVSTLLPAQAPAEMAGQSPFVLVPGVVVDADRSSMYLMNPAGGIDALALESGQHNWHSDEASKPLLVVDASLLAQVESATSDPKLEVVELDRTRNGRKLKTYSLELPEGVEASIVERLGRSFDLSVSQRDGERLISWKYTKRYVKGVAPGPDDNLEESESGGVLLNPLSGQAVVLSQAPQVDAVPLPATVAEWLASSGRSLRPVRVGPVFAISQQSGEHVILKRWDASGVPLPDIPLFSGPSVARIRSADERHLLVAEQRAPGEFLEYEWNVYSLATGASIGKLRHHRSHAPFFVHEGSIIYVDAPFAHLKDGNWVEEGRSVRAVLFNSGALVWERPLRDLTYRGPFPP